MSDEKPSAWTPPRLGEFIREHKKELVGEWLEAMRRLPKSQQLSFERRIDHIPRILERIASAADSEGPDVALHLAEGPDLHALQRLDEGYDLREVVREYAVLRTVV